MSLNCAEIDLILSELKPQGCFIQKIRQPDFESLILELYRPGEKRFSVGFYLGHGKTAVLPVTGKPPADGRPQRFVQFLKSRVGGVKPVSAQTAVVQRNVDLRSVGVDLNRRSASASHGGDPCRKTECRGACTSKPLFQNTLH